MKRHQGDGGAPPSVLQHGNLMHVRIAAAAAINQAGVVAFVNLLETATGAPWLRWRRS
jgi:hypothetical protein